MAHRPYHAIFAVHLAPGMSESPAWSGGGGVFSRKAAMVQGVQRGAQPVTSV